MEVDNQERKKKTFEEITSKDIIDAAIIEKDPLCLKVVEKFTQNFGHEVGNLALKTMPYGGIYLIGGVTSGIQDYLKCNNTFKDSFCNKGRLSELMK